MGRGDARWTDLSAKKRQTIGIDIGGTNVKAGVVDDRNVMVAKKSIATEAERGFQHVFDRIVALIDELIGSAGLSRAELAAIGCGSPGPLSHDAGIIYAAPNMPGWTNIALRELLEGAVGVRVSLENDANAAAFGEFTSGAGRGARHMVMLTLGTGIGGGIVANGRLLRGAFENAGEIGHFILYPDGQACPCGQRGCFERYASASAVARRFQRAALTGAETSLNNETVTSHKVATAARSGDALAKRIWDEACRDLARGCVSVQRLVSTRRFVLGGGLSGAGDQLLGPLRRHFAELTWNIADDVPEFELARLGNDAGVIGAAALARLEYDGASE